MSYITLPHSADAEFIERRSRFIGHAAPAATEEEALRFVSEVKARYADASHNVWAYHLQQGRERYSDDGEPQGTAGPPVLDVLKKSGVVDAVVVVTRYFGGVLLGAGGLVRAYSHAAHLALEEAGPCEVFLCADLRFSVDYTLYGKVQYLLPEYGAQVLDTDFAADVTLTVRLRAERAEALKAFLLDLSGGSCQAQVAAEGYYPL